MIDFIPPDDDDFHWAEAQKRIAELERAYDVLAEEKLDKLVSHKKRIAELEALVKHWEDTCHAQAETCAAAESAANEYLRKYQRLRDAIDLIHERLRLAYSLTYDDLYERAKECYHIAKLALEKERYERV